MAFLFWLLWSFDLLSLLLVVLAKGFRDQQHLGAGLHVWLILGLILVLAGGPIVRFVLKNRLLSLLIVAMPAAAMLVAYLVDKAKGA